MLSSGVERYAILVQLTEFFDQKMNNHFDLMQTNKSLNVSSNMYNLTYSVCEYMPKKFYLKVEGEEEGFAPQTDYFYFDTITRVSGSKVPDSCDSITVEFLTAPVYTKKYSFERFTEGDLDKVLKFFTNIMEGHEGPQVALF